MNAAVDDGYRRAVQRNLGLVSDEEQRRLRASRVALAGCGGVGGIHLLTLARIGVGAFNLADLDEFDLVNMNRQVGATRHTLGRPKVDVMAEFARDIQPGVQIRPFARGVQPDNVEQFLRDVDLVIDAIDFFAIESRRLLYRAARQAGITVIFSAPIGHSGTLHVFSPEGMSFDDYFDIRDDMSPFDKTVAFAVGLTPRGTHWAYMDTARVDLSEQSGPSLASACATSAGLLTTEALALLLDRRAPRAAPRYAQFDPYRGIYRRGRLRWGNRGPLQRLKRWAVSRRFRDQAHLLEPH